MFEVLQRTSDVEDSARNISVQRENTFWALLHLPARGKQQRVEVGHLPVMFDFHLFHIRMVLFLISKHICEQLN